MFPTYQHVRIPTYIGPSGPSYGSLESLLFDGRSSDPIFQSSTVQDGGLFHRYPSGPKFRKVGPFWRVWERPLVPYDFHRKHDRIPLQVNFFESTFQNRGIPRELQHSLVEEAVEDAQKRLLYDPFKGNVLHLYDDPIDHQEWLLAPGGKLGNELFSYELNDRNLRSLEFMKPHPFPHLRFDTPIYEVASSSLQPRSDCLRLLGIRSFTGIHIICPKRNHEADDGDLSTLEYFPIFEHRSNVRPCKIAFNPVIPAQAAWICEDNFVYVWDLTISASLDRQLVGTRINIPTYEGQSNNTEWKCIDYAWHPRVLLVGDSKGISTFDLRSSESVLNSLYKLTSPTNPTLRGMQRNQSSEYEIGACSTESVFLLDARYPRKPLLEWATDNQFDAPSGIQFVSADTEKAIITWCNRTGEILSFPISTHKKTFRHPPHSIRLPSAEHTQKGMSQQPPNSHYAPQRIPPFHIRDKRYTHSMMNGNQKKRIPLFNPDEPQWFSQDAAKKGATESLKKKASNTSASEDEQESEDSEGSESMQEDEEGASGNGPNEQAHNEHEYAYIQRDHLRRQVDMEIPKWPCLEGVAIRYKPSDGFHVFQCAEDGAVYAERLKAAFDEPEDVEERHASDWEDVDASMAATTPRRRRPAILTGKDAHPQTFEDSVEGAAEKAMVDELWDVLQGNHDFSTYFQYFSKLLNSPFPEHDDPFRKTRALTEKLEKVAEDIVSSSVPQTLFEVLEKYDKAKCTTYKDGFPVLPHPRAPAELQSHHCIRAVVDAINTRLSMTPDQHGKVYAKQVDLHSMGMFSDLVEGSPDEHGMKFSHSAIRKALEKEFPESKCYPTLDDSLAEGVKLVTGEDLKRYLNELKDRVRKTSLDWIARDIYHASIGFDGDYETEIVTTNDLDESTTAMEDVDSEVEQDKDKSLEMQVIGTINAFMKDKDLNLPRSVRFKGPLLFGKQAAQLSEEAIVMRDKWVNPHNWYGEHLDARLRMQSESQTLNSGTFSPLAEPDWSLCEGSVS